MFHAPVYVHTDSTACTTCIPHAILMHPSSNPLPLLQDDAATPFPPASQLEDGTATPFPNPFPARRRYI